MDGEQLHDTRLRRLGPRHQLIRALGLVEPREQAADAPPLIGREERPHLVGEGTQLRGRDTCGAPGLGGRELDVQAEFELDESDQLRIGCDEARRSRSSISPAALTRARPSGVIDSSNR